MPVKITKNQAMATVTVDDSLGTTEQKIMVGEPITSTGALCNVGMSLGGTVNLGNFENLKYTISLYKPCTEDAIDEAFTEVQAWLDSRVGEFMANVGKALGTPGAADDEG